MSRVSDSTISFGTDHHEPMSSSYSAMTRTMSTKNQSPQYPQTNILQNRKSDIFNLHEPSYSGQSDKPSYSRKMSWQRNSSNLFNEDSMPPAGAGYSQRANYANIPIAAPSAEHLAPMHSHHQSKAPQYIPSSSEANKRQLSSKGADLRDYESVANMNCNELNALESCEYPQHQEIQNNPTDYDNYEPDGQYPDEKYYNQPIIENRQSDAMETRNSSYASHHQHSDIFDTNSIDNQVRSGRRHYNQGRSSSDIFNLGGNDDNVSVSSKRFSETLPTPQWAPGSSFSNLFGGQAQYNNDYETASSVGSISGSARRRRQEPSMASRPGGMSSTELHRERGLPSGRPTYSKTQEQTKSQIWF